MDSPIYRLLARAEQEKNVEFLKEAFYLLDPDIESSKEEASKDIENFSQNLYVECAEKAINFREFSIANRCIQLYFSLPMISNQFLARAYLCQFELLAPRSSTELDKLEKSVPFLYKAIDFSTQNKRYNFLVYNASVLFWKYARSFLKTNFKRQLCASLLRISQALKEIDDADYEWRFFLEKTLIESYIDNKQLNEAKRVASELAKFVQNYLPNLFDEYFEFLMSNNLLDDDELKSFSASKWELNSIYRMEKLKKFNKVKTKSAKNDEMSEESILNELNEIYKVLIPKRKNYTDKSKSTEFLNSTDLTGKKDDYIAIVTRQRLLLNLARLCLYFEETNLSSRILGYLKEAENLNEKYSLELEFIECEQTVKELKHKQERYTKNIVKLRTDTINKCHEVLRNALRYNNPRLIQMGCIIQWNICLSLLQPGLRNNVRKPLQFVAECLEIIDSMEWLLRCQIHFELAKCDEEIEQLQTAEQHLLKAIQLDDEKIYTEQLEHSLKRLRLRAELYKTPERTEDQVTMLIEQCVVGGKPGTNKKLKPAIGELLEMLNQKNTGIKSSSGEKSEINTRSLLLRAADLLAPNEFTRVLESETFKADFGKLNEDKVTRMHKKSLNYENCIKKGVEHLNERINDISRNFKRNNPDASNSNVELESILKNDFKERFKLWFDLTKIARKQQIWDICRVSARFCMLYDNQQYINRFLKTGGKFNSFFDNELMRNLAEAHFVLAESLIQYIRGEGIELFEKPNIPDLNENNSNTKQVRIAQKKLDQSNQLKENKLASQLRDFENDLEWKEYCDWLNKLCKEAIDNFLKGIQIGVELKESWLVCQGSAYIWNYLHHIFVKNKHVQILPILNEIYDALKKVGHDTEPELLVAVCVAISTGLTKPWLPQDQVKTLQIPVISNDLQNEKKRQAGGAQISKPFTLPAEGLTDFKKSLEICEYAMNVTNGEDLKDIVSLKDRFSLIKAWVLAKQICQSPIKNFGLVKSSANNERIQDKYTKCMIGVEILNRNLKLTGPYEIKEAPTIKDIINLIDLPQSWPDKLIELELWSNLCILSGKSGQTDNLRYCYTKALETISYFEKKKTENKSIYLKSQFLLSEACIALGEHLATLLNSPNPLTTSKSKDSLLNDQIQGSAVSITSSISKDIRLALRRNALNAFADATSYAANAENYDYVVHAARHYWNLCLPYLSQPLERATLYENLTEILSSWNTVYKFKPQEESVEVSQENNIKKQEEKKEPEPTNSSAKGNKSKKLSRAESEAEPKKEENKPRSSKSPGKQEKGTELENKSTNSFLVKQANQSEDAFDDLTLRCVLYACLFQISLDKNQYEEALEQMEVALSELPRTKHRLLIYRFKVITKSKLGLDVQMDLQKFREESEKNLAQMYRKVALSSIKHSDTINSYQRAIETLNSDESIWLKFEYILELAQYMYSNEFNLESCIDLCEWAIDLIIFKIKIDKSSRAESAVILTGRQSSKSSAKARFPNKAQMSVSVMPTIQDDVEIKTVHKNIEKNAQDELDNLLKLDNKENLFEASSLEWNKNLNWSDLQDIKQLECLIRANTILCQMVGRSSQNYSSYLLKAYYSVNRLFSQAIENGVNSLKEIQKLNAQAEVVTDKNDKKKGSQADAKKTVAQDAQKTQKKGKDSYTYPQTIEQWSQFDLNEEITNAWTHDLMKKTGINQKTISEPYLLFYYLEQLGKMLNEQGYTQLLFPIYNLQLIIINSSFSSESNSQLQNISLNIYIRIKLINLCVELNLVHSVGFHQQALANLILNSKQTASPETINLITTTAANPNPTVLFKLIQIDPIEICFSREQIYAHKQRLAQLEEDETTLSANSTASFSSSKKGFSTNSILNSKLKLKKRLQSNKSQVKISDSENTIKTQTISNVSLDSDDIKLSGEQKRISNNLHEILYKDVWIIIAEFLIQNGYFQIARDYLFESLNASLSFEDISTVAKVKYLLGKIALFDCSFIEARNYASEAQKIAIDEMFWFKTIRLLVESQRYDYNDKDAYEKSIKLLNKALDILTEEKSVRKNKSINLVYIEAMLNYDLAEITADGVLNGKLNEQDIIRRSRSNKKGSRRNSMHPSLFKKLSHVCNNYHMSFEILMNNGFKREAVEVLKSYARLLKQFGNDCSNLEAKQDYHVQSYNLLNDGLNILNEIMIDSMSLQSSLDIQNISLPIQRELIEIKLEISKLLTDILEIHLNEIKLMNQENLNKNQIDKLVENYVSHIENLNETEQEWHNLIAQLPDLLSINLISCHSLSTKLKNFKANTLYLIGRTYRLISELKYQLKKINLNEENSSFSNTLNLTRVISKWTPLIFDIIKNQQQSENESSGTKSKAKSIKSMGQVDGLIKEENNFDPINLNPLIDNVDSNSNFKEESNMTSLSEKDNLKNLLTHVNHLEAQGIECLLQAQNLSFSIEDKILTRNISYELIEFIGRFDMNLCSQYISLYQSLSNAIEAENIIQKSSLNPKNSLLSGYLNQLKFYKKTNTTQNTLNSPITKQLLDMTKSKFNAFKYLNINSNHFNFSKDLPSNYIFLILQHNETKNELYAAFIDRQKTGSGAKNSKQQGSSALGSGKASVIKVKTDPFELHYLQNQWKEWKLKLQSFNLKIEFQLNNDLIKKQATSSSITNSVEQNELLKYYIESSSTKYEEMLRQLTELENKFEFLIESTEMYFKEITEFVQNYFNSTLNEQIQVQQNSKQSTTSKSTDKLIILADMDSLELPLESLKVFYDNINLCSVTRDFSMQFFATRFFAPKESIDPVKDDKKRDKSSKANVKQAQAPPVVLEPLPEYANIVDQNRVKYLIDPFNEASSGLPSDSTPLGSFKILAQQYAQVFSKWNGLTGQDHSPSLGECENLLLDSSCFLFNGTERFLSFFSCNKIASLNLNECRLIIANDLAQTSKSFSRLGKEDVLRNPSELECENPLMTSILLSLTGVRCVMSNQWTTTLVDNCERFSSILKEFIENRQSSGEILRNKMSPHLKQIMIDNAKKEEARLALKDAKKTKETVDKTAKKNESGENDEVQHVNEEQSKEVEEEAKRLELIKNLSKIKKENLNMVCYGLPDVYMSS